MWIIPIEVPPENTFPECAVALVLPPICPVLDSEGGWWTRRARVCECGSFQQKCLEKKHLA